MYRRLGNQSPATASSRLGWLQRQPKAYRPQPFLHVAKILKELGQERDAIEVLITKEDVRTRYGAFTTAKQAWRWVEKVTIGYGYRPLLALRFVVVFVLLGWCLFSAEHNAGVVAPTEEKAFSDFHDKHRLPPYYTPFNGLVYSLETFFPLVDFGLKKSWAPCSQLKVLWKLGAGGHLRSIDAGKLLRSYLYLHMLAGWFFTVMLAAGVSGLVRKE